MRKMAMKLFAVEKIDELKASGMPIFGWAVTSFIVGVGFVRCFPMHHNGTIARTDNLSVLQSMPLEDREWKRKVSEDEFGWKNFHLRLFQLNINIRTDFRFLIKVNIAIHGLFDKELYLVRPKYRTLRRGLRLEKSFYWQE